MRRFIPTLIAAALVFGGWMFLRAKFFTPPARSAKSAAAGQAVQEEILWSANETDPDAAGDDPRAVFASSLNRYLSTKVSGASIIPLDQIDSTIVSMNDELATVKTTVGGVHYRGLLRWGANGWELIQLSREK